MHGSFRFPGSGFRALGLEMFAQSGSCLAPQELSREPHDEDPFQLCTVQKGSVHFASAFSEFFALSDSCLGPKPPKEPHES